MDVLGAAVNLAPVPYLNLAFSLFQLIVTSTEQVQTNKEQFRLLKDTVATLLRTVDREYKNRKLRVESTRTAIADLNKLGHLDSERRPAS